MSKQHYEHAGTFFPRDEQRVMRRVVARFWESLEKLSVDEIDRVIGELYHWNYERHLKEQGLVHKSGEVAFPFLSELRKKRLGGNLVDHVGKVIKNGKILSYVLEPYGILMDDLAEFMEFCKEKGWQFTISGDSPHFIGRTVRINVVTKKN